VNANRRTIYGDVCDDGTCGTCFRCDPGFVPPIYGDDEAFARFLTSPIPDDEWQALTAALFEDLELHCQRRRDDEHDLVTVWGPSGAVTALQAILDAHEVDG